jgi:aminoglycoside phosphotransferase (APT) family kinase protein
VASSALADIPATHRETVAAALTACFGMTPIDAVVPMTVGASAGVILRLEVRRHSYLLRVEGPRSPLRYPDQYLALRLAAGHGLAPKVHHVDAAAGVMVTDFIEARPLHCFPGGAPALAKAMGALLARLHAMPAPPPFTPYPEIVARLFAHVRRTGLFVPGLLDRHLAHLERIRAAYDWDPACSVACHNDCLPANILFDGARLWLIDWESAYPNDPLIDVAIQLDNLARSPELGDLLLRTWLGRPPDDAFRHRLEQARALTRLYYAGVLLSASARLPRAKPDDSLDVSVAAAMTVHARGKLYLRGFLTGEAVPGFG